MKRYFRRSTRGKSVKFQIKLEENIEEELIDPILLTPIEKDEPIVSNTICLIYFLVCI